MPNETPAEIVNETPQEPMVPVSEGVTLTNDSQDDSTLEQILGSDPETDDSPQHSTGSPQMDGLTEGESSSQSPEVADKATDEDSVDSVEDGGKPAEPDAEDYAKAVSALKRDGVPKDVIDQMADENPQSVIDWGLKRAKVQSDVDSYGSKVKELEDKIASYDSSEASKESEEQPAVDQAVSKPTESLETLNRHESEIAEVFGEDAAKSVMSPIRDLVAETSSVLKKQQEMIQMLYGEIERRGVLESRNRLGERFPQLKDDESFATVVEQMTKLAKVGEYQSIDDLMSDAYRLKYARVAEVEAKQNEQGNLRDAGQPTVMSQSNSPARSKTIQDREDDVLDALLSGMGQDGAIAAFND